MKNLKSKYLLQTALLFGFISVTLVSCDKNEVTQEDPVASFQYTISESNYLEVTFTNYSQNAETYSWDFGDGNSSADKDPVHTYEEAGDYTVVLTVYNVDDVSKDYTETITITDPNEAYKLLTGETSKTWKLYREGVCMSLGESADNAANWWAGLENDGARPCLYNQTFTFHFDGTYVFDDGGMFWGEYGVFDGTANFETCFEAIASNMINKDGVDVSAWLSGTHSFTYDPSAGTATLSGTGAWIGIPKLGTTGETAVPSESVTFNLNITQETGYDLMTVGFDYGDGGYWKIVYVSYENWDDEPEVITEEAPYGEDLEDITPASMFITFASKDAADMAVLDTITSGSLVDFGVDDPAGGAAKVGKFIRTATQYQELQFMANPPKDINFSNFTKVSFDVYVPSTNDYTGGLTKTITFGIAETSQTEEWWNGHIQWDVAEADVVTDQWKTYTFDLSAPTSGPGAGSYTALSRTDLDMLFINIGGSGHTVEGTFYIRNLIFE